MPEPAHICSQLFDGNGDKRATWPTIEEAARHLKIGKSTLYQMPREGKVPAQKLGRAWWFDQEELDAWMKQGRLGSQANGPNRPESQRGSYADPHNTLG